MPLFRRTFLIASVVWTALTGAAMSQNAALTGTAAYRERMALPPDAVLVVRLSDVSRMDVAATVLASQSYAMQSVPQAFTLAYDPALIDERFSYSVSAEIRIGDKVMFRTTQANPVLTRGAGTHVDLVLTRAADKAAATRLTGRWDVVEIAGAAIDAERKPVMDFTETGRIGIKGACNTFVGSAKSEGGKLTFDKQMASTMMACDEAAEQLDRDMMAALETTERYLRSGNRMDFVDGTGVTVLRMRRVE